MHIPVLLSETIEFLNLHPGDNIIDCTLGLGGHSQEILKRTAPNGKLLGIDADAEALKIAQNNLKDFSERAIFVQGNFRDLEKIIQAHHFKNINGILMDLGMSSLQIDQSKRGFSFSQDEPLDMRFEQSQVKTAENILNHYSYSNLIRVFKEFGDFRKDKAKMLAREILGRRRRHALQTTFDFKDLIIDVFSPSPSLKDKKSKFKKNIGEAKGKLAKTKINLIARAFQALRIEVNRELDSLGEGLAQALAVLKPGGRMVIISFHSGEDRIVKNFFRDKARQCICPASAWTCTCQHQPEVKILTKKPIKAGTKEIQLNPRARSARMRVAQKE